MSLDIHDGGTMRNPELDRRPLFMLLIANVVSGIGNSLTFMAIPWFVLATTGSASKTGIAVAVGAVPVILAGVFGGAIVDRLGYKRTSVISDLASGVTTMMIPLLYHTVGLAYWQLLVLVFLGAALDSPGHTARQSLLPELVIQSGIGAERGNTLWTAGGRIAGLLGPPLAGLLIAAIGASNLLWVDAATFGISAAIVALGIQDQARPVFDSAVKGLRGYLADVRDGFRFLFDARIVLWMVLSFALGSFLAEPIYSVLLPVYSREVFGDARYLGFIFSALGAGSLVGNGLYALVAMRVSRRLLFIGGFAVRAIAFWLMVTTPEWWVIALGIFVSAALFEPINPLFMTVAQERVPAGMRGRVFGAGSAIGAGTLPLGVVMYGFLLEGIGMQPTLVLFAIVNSAIPIILCLLPSLRSMDEPVLSLSRATATGEPVP
jgi:MFS family permease